ncbi:MAG: SDR family NAD(P)-dependent oxidoreductase [Acidobacteria bacterium]|nr:SDR family NAD(P)-dependent oxidoreductase [Acidobacteriota bacterium]
MPAPSKPAPSIAEKVCVITGASMGIGEAIARRFAREGAKVVLSSRDPARVEAARARIGLNVRTLALACDVRNREEIDRLVSLTVHNFGSVDVWVNNAGHGLRDSVAHMDMAACRSMYDTNLFAAIECMQAVIPVMRQQGSGTIINISSVAGHIALPFSAAYGSTKFAMNCIGKAARLELIGSGVHVLTVCPGWIDTPFHDNAIKGTDHMRLGGRRKGISADRVASAVLRGYLKQKREVVVPWTNHISIKMYQLFPQVVEWAILRMLQPADAEGVSQTTNLTRR